MFGAVFAHEVRKVGKTCLVIDKREHIGGNIYTEEIEGIQVHRYGAHIFHTSNERVWKYVNQFAKFNHFVNSPVAVYKDELYNLPFNMNTFYQLWGVKTPAQAKAKIQEQISQCTLCIPIIWRNRHWHWWEKTSMKSWWMDILESSGAESAKSCPQFIIKRLPVRYTFDNNYFKDPYQGIPIGGYTKIVKKLLEGVQVCLKTDFFKHREELVKQAEKVVFTGMIDHTMTIA